MAKKARRKPLHSVWSNAAFLLGDIARRKKLLMVLLLVEAVCTIVVPLFGIYLPKLAVDLVAESASVERVFSTLGVLVLVMMAVLALQSMANRAKYQEYNGLRSWYMNQICLRAFDCPYEQMESAAGLNRFQKAIHTLATGDWSGTSVMLVNMLAICTSSISFLLYSGIIATLSPWIVLLLIGLSAVNYFALRAARRYEEGRRDEQAALERHIGYIESEVADPAAGKDVRLYQMANWFMTLWEHFLADYASLLHKIQTRHTLSGVVNALTMALRDGVSYGYLIWLVLHGSLSVGDFVLYFGAITGFSGWISQLVTYSNAILGANVQMNDMREFLECTNEPEPARPAGLPPLDRPLSIEFRDVSFSYGPDTEAVLRHVSLIVQPGERLALVGINGAGKTTLVKLLCGLYRPDSGSILVGGVDIAQCRRADVYRLYTAVFQDLAFYSFSVAENVSMAPLVETDEARVWACLERAGLVDVIRRYDNGIRQTMSKDFDPAGVVLSGGQQQQLLMARVLYKDAPVMILDEPTAALDPIAESETYERFHELSRGKTALYISHRLASTRFCDHIAFLQDGEVAEYGTHEELLRKNGAYARMFAIQSHYYKSENEVEQHG